MVRKNRRPHNYGASQTEDGENFFSRLFKNQRFLAFVGLVLLVLIAFPLLKTYSQKRLIEEEMAQIKADIARYEQETAQFQDMIEYLGSEQSLEAQARMNLNLKKPGETVVVIERESETLNDKTTQEESDQDSNLKKWKKYFFSTRM